MHAPSNPIQITCAYTLYRLQLADIRQLTYPLDS